MQFRGLRRQTRCAERPAAEKDKPTKGAEKGGIVSVLLAVMGLLFVATPIRAQDESSVLYPGTYQAEDARVTLPEDAKIVYAEGAEGEKAVETKNIKFSAYGTDVIIRWHSDIGIVGALTGGKALLNMPGDTNWRKEKVPLIVALDFDKNDNLTVIDSMFYNVGIDETGWVIVTAGHSIFPRKFDVELESLDNNLNMYFVPPPIPVVQIDSITVLNRTFENVFPYIAAIGITLGMMLFVVASALRERWRR